MKRAAKSTFVFCEEQTYLALKSHGCARTLHLTVPKQRKKKKDFTHILLGAKYFIQSLDDSCLLANRTMTVLWRHMQV